ncbi:hypothetical protein [Ornithinimicrobium pratense]|uniref:TOMM leader peptide-binding protein n=1 Tax=Ornithinimicrobium pratense TaxID=2593973 RepID=A0A5J6V5B0_9MICO|nr:hypothetical protein [Ornithinimicrobium pratense]QFG69170.1 hypothetical protein FY030_11055 [Ornithinimicrobium pratense]
MERPTWPARGPSGSSGGWSAAAADGPVEGPGVVAHLRRPDGQLQVGVGPRSWVVHGWSPASSPAASPASLLVRALSGDRPWPPGPPALARPCRVVGHGELAVEMRRHLGSAADPGAAGGPVVLVTAYAVPVGTARRPDLVSTPVLPVVAQSSRVVVGPWTGLRTGPCLHCLDLHRVDADPAWPALAAALDDPVTCPPPPRHGADVMALVTALAGLLVDGLRCDGRDADGLAYEVGAQRPHLVLRRWPTHAACPWHPGGTGATGRRVGG